MATRTATKRTTKSKDAMEPSEDWVVTCAKKMLHERQQPSQIAAFIEAVVPHVVPVAVKR